MSDVLGPSVALHSKRPAAASARGLADHLELAAIAVDRTRMPMAVTDPNQPDNPIILANPAFLTLTGYAADEVIGRNCRFLQGEGTSASTIAEMKSAVSEERDFTIEVLNYRKDGSAFWNQLHVSPIYGDDGKLLYFFASQEDVTEFRKVQDLEATEHRLLKEIDHRARNVLAVVSGIVRLSRPDDPVLYAAAVQQRVQALAAAHTLLADRGWHDIPLEEIIRQQVSGFNSDRVKVDGPRVLVSALNVQPLALVIHELMFNATTHGALSSPTGTLTVHWDADRTPGGFELRWEEANGPSPTDAPRSGFGTVMLQAMIKRQLRGEARQQWSDKGLVVTLMIPGSSEARKVLDAID